MENVYMYVRMYYVCTYLYVCMCVCTYLCWTHVCLLPYTYNNLSQHTQTICVHTSHTVEPLFVATFQKTTSINRVPLVCLIWDASHWHVYIHTSWNKDTSTHRTVFCISNGVLFVEVLLCVVCVLSLYHNYMYIHMYRRTSLIHYWYVRISEHIDHVPNPPLLLPIIKLCSILLDLSNIWFIRHLVYPTSGLSDIWFIQHLVYLTSGLSDIWFIWHLVYPTSGLSDIFHEGQKWLNKWELTALHI